MPGLLDTSAWDAKVVESELPQCGACGLFKKCKSPKMPPSGRGKRKILFVGEYSGEQEDAEGVRFVGKAGKCFKDMLRPLDLDLADCSVTDSIICHPPANKIEDLHISACRPNLINTIRDLKPNVVILLGSSAVKSLISTEWYGDIGQLGKWVGWNIPSQKYGCWICPTFHPSWIERQGRDELLVKLVTQDLKRAIALENTPVPITDIEKVRQSVEVITEPRLARKRIADLALKEGILAFDWETKSLKPERKETGIYSASFCLDGIDTLACLADEACYDAIRSVLVNPRLRKVASNFKFEERWSRQKLGVAVKGWLWCTMLAAHYLDNRPGITSIKFQGYIRLGIGEYNKWAEPFLQAKRANDLNRITEAPVGDVLRYNGVDSWLEYTVAMEQMREMGFNV